jgi:hypothetical protein
MNDIRVRVLEKDEWAAYRDVRLRALHPVDPVLVLERLLLLGGGDEGLG